MGKLIDVDDLFKGEACGYTHWDYIKKKCESLPEAVVRCKDCESYDTSKKDVFCKSLCKCKNLGSYMGENEFCSSGGRRK